MKTIKGNWRIRPTQALNENGKPLFYDICINGGSFIATHKNQYIGIGDEEQLANAKLIACAPEMLELLKKIEQDYDCGTDTYKVIVELIKKATE